MNSASRSVPYRIGHSKLSPDAGALLIPLHPAQRLGRGPDMAGIVHGPQRWRPNCFRNNTGPSDGTAQGVAIATNIWRSLELVTVGVMCQRQLDAWTLAERPATALTRRRAGRARGIRRNPPWSFSISSDHSSSRYAERGCMPYQVFARVEAARTDGVRTAFIERSYALFGLRSARCARQETDPAPASPSKLY